MANNPGHSDKFRAAGREKFDLNLRSHLEICHGKQTHADVAEIDTKTIQLGRLGEYLHGGVQQLAFPPSPVWFEAPFEDHLSTGKDTVAKRSLRVPEESHSGIVPMNQSNKDRKPSAENEEGRPLIKENAGQPNTHPTQSGERVSQGLAGVRKAARNNKEMKFTSLLHHLTVDLLRESFYSLKRKAAPGVDGVTWQEYEVELEDRLTDLHGWVHRGAYRALPSRRVYIEKEDGRQRPLAIPALEDKLVQQAVVTVLNQIYEEDFLGFCVLQKYTDKEVMMT